MPGRLSPIVEAVPQLIATATLRIDTGGAGFTEITGIAKSFVAQASAPFPKFVIHCSTL
jgi:hypothetical protein